MASHPILRWDNPVHTRIIELRAQGVSVPKIVEQLAKDDTPLAYNTVYQIVREYANAVRDEALQRGEERFAEHDARYEYLYGQIQRRLARAAENDEYDDGKFAALVRAAVAVLDRQARLLGIDKVKTPNSPAQHDWLDRATPGQLVELAQKFELKLPEKFVNQN